MKHIAFFPNEENGEKGTTQLLEPVSDKDYNG